MGLFRSIKRAFGFSDNGDEPNDELDGINGERAARRPYVNPFKNDDKPEQETGSFEGAPGETTSDEVTEQLLGEVIAIVNHNLPPFVVDNLDVEAERKSIGEALKPSVDAFMKQVKAEAATDHRHDKDTIAELQEKAKTTEAQRRAVLAKYNDLQNKVATLEAEREQLELENKSLLNKMKVMKVKAGDTDFSDIDEAVATMDSSKREMEALTEEYQKKMEITNALLAEFRADSSAKAEDLKKLNETLVQKEKALEELEARCKAMEEQLAEAQSETDLIDEVQEKIEQFEQIKLKKDQEINDLRQQLASYESSSGATSTKIASMKRRNDELEKTISKLTRQAADTSEKRNRRDIEVANQYNDLKTKYNDTLKTLGETQAEVERLQAEAKVTEGIVNEMSKKNETLAVQYRDTNALLTLTKDELENAREHIVRLEQDLENRNEQDAKKAQESIQAMEPEEEIAVEMETAEVEPDVAEESLPLEQETTPIEEVLEDILPKEEVAAEVAPVAEKPVEEKPAVQEKTLEAVEEVIAALEEKNSDPLSDLDDIDWLVPTPPSNKPKEPEIEEVAAPEPPKKQADSRQMSLF
ncbi:MAG: hypothetical protein J5523_00820 [Muribaculaceae bacterium]|nr:hypothetical protein [Muribaculaceae bacterium]